MKEFDYIVYKEGKYFVSQCLNVNVSSFGETEEEAVRNLKEAVELYCEDEEVEFRVIDRVQIGREMMNV